MRTLLTAAGALLVAHSASAAQYWYYCDDSKTYYPYVTACKTPWRAVQTSPEALQQKQLGQEPKAGQTKQETERQAKLNPLIECMDKVQRPLLFRVRETVRAAPIDTAVTSCGLAAPAGVTKKDVTEAAVSNLDRLLRGQREAAHRSSEPVGTHPMPDIQNSPETLCDAPVAGEPQGSRYGGLRPCADDEFEKLREQMRRMWVLTPDWLQAECLTNSTFPNLFACVQDWTVLWVATHADAKAPWIRPGLGEVPMR